GTSYGAPVPTRRASDLGLLLVDCDRFKEVNDEHGHLVRDRVLQGVANILRSAAGPDDLACRLGGDEFCLLVAAERKAEILRIAQDRKSTRLNSSHVKMS